MKHYLKIGKRFGLIGVTLPDGRNIPCQKWRCMAMTDAAGINSKNRNLRKLARIRRAIGAVRHYCPNCGAKMDEEDEQ